MEGRGAALLSNIVNRKQTTRAGCQIIVEVVYHPSKGWGQAEVRGSPRSMQLLSETVSSHGAGPSRRQRQGS